MIIRKMRYTIIITLAAIALSSCSRKELQVNNMVLPYGEKNLSPFNRSCYVSEVEGRKEANNILPLTSNLLEQAIMGSLKSCNVFSTVIKSDRKDADYTLSVRLLGQPQDGSSTTTCLYTRYKLIRNATGEVIFDKRYQTVYTSEEKDMNKSMEGAVKGNIKELVYDISKLQL
jgi:hypothetical protein